MKSNNHLDDVALYSVAATIETAQYRAEYATKLKGIKHIVKEIDGGFYAVPVEANNAHLPKTNKSLDDDVDYFELDLVKYLDDTHILKRLSISTANAIQLPVSSVFLSGLGVFSSISCRRYVVCYQHGGDIPIGLYTIIEQPSGTGKSWCLSTFQKPFFKTHDVKVKAYQKQLTSFKNIPKEEQTPEEKQELKDLLDNPPMPLFSTNPTPEALEQSLNQTGGFFAVISSEQGALNSMLGYAYGEKGRANNNDLLLNGFDGGHINSMRINRGGYCGDVIGALVSFAQSGSIEKMIKASEGTGLAERALFAAEPHYLGRRDRTRSTAISRELLDEYSDISTALLHKIYNHTGEGLAALVISENGHKLIQEYLIDIEPHLIDGGKYSHSYLRGAASKLNIQIMKIAANLHLTSSIDSFCDNQIDDKYIDSAIEIVHAIFEASVQICTKKGFIGEKAEIEALLSYLSKDSNKAKTERQIINSLRTTQPFKSYSGSTSKAIRKALDDALAQNAISQSNGKFSIG